MLIMLITYITVQFTYFISVADPDSVLFFTPGSGISFFQIPDRNHISESLVTIFWG
jgi:hypothetical protein